MFNILQFLGNILYVIVAGIYSRFVGYFLVTETAITKQRWTNYLDGILKKNIGAENDIFNYIRPLRKCASSLELTISNILSIQIDQNDWKFHSFWSQLKDLQFGTGSKLGDKEYWSSSVSEELVDF